MNDDTKDTGEISMDFSMVIRIMPPPLIEKISMIMGLQNTVIKMMDEIHDDIISCHGMHPDIKIQLPLLSRQKDTSLFRHNHGINTLILKKWIDEYEVSINRQNEDN